MAPYRVSAALDAQEEMPAVGGKEQRLIRWFEAHATGIMQERGQYIPAQSDRLADRLVYMLKSWHHLGPHRAVL
jgi:hypothetical protein